MDAKERIFALLDEKKIEQKAFAEMVGVSEATVSNWRVGKSNSFMRFLPQIAEALGTTVEYLSTGKGSPSPVGDELLRDINALYPENLDRLKAFAAFLRASQEKP